MPPVSKQQMKAAQIAEGVKEGKVKAKTGSPSATMAKSMNKKQIQEFTKAPSNATLPNKIKAKGKPSLPSVPAFPVSNALPPRPMRIKGE